MVKYLFAWGEEPFAKQVGRWEDHDPWVMSHHRGRKLSPMESRTIKATADVTSLGSGGRWDAFTPSLTHSLWGEGVGSTPTRIIPSHDLGTRLTQNWALLTILIWLHQITRSPPIKSAQFQVSLDFHNFNEKHYLDWEKSQVRLSYRRSCCRKFFLKVFGNNI